MRILVTAHGHPDFSLGGGELAAHHLHLAYQAHPQVHKSTFLARADSGRWPSGALSKHAEGEYLWDQAVHDWHYLKAAQRDSLDARLAPLLERLQPTVVHSHHYAHLGLDHLLTVRRILPKAQIWLTLHEFMAICRNNGQMVKTQSNALCSESSPAACHRCFPASTAEDFWLRREFILDRLGVVDGFIAPSHFLRQRYLEWGLPADRIHVIENGQAPDEPLPPRVVGPGQGRNRFGFFGQINPYKGLDLVLKALTLLSKAEQRTLTLEVHGAHFDAQPLELRERIAGLLQPLERAGVVQWIGPYRPEDKRQRLQGIDWLVVPSIWWENSPLVIQEAFSAGRPVICSGIGGMAEKVRPGVDGLHVPVGNAYAWAQTLLRAAQEPALWALLHSGVPKVLSHEQCAVAHLKLFEQGPREPMPWRP